MKQKEEMEQSFDRRDPRKHNFTTNFNARAGPDPSDLSNTRKSLGLKAYGGAENL